MVKKTKKRICFISTVDFTINAFLTKQLRELSHFYDVTVIANTTDKSFLKKQPTPPSLVVLYLFNYWVIYIYIISI